MTSRDRSARLSVIVACLFFLALSLAGSSGAQDSETAATEETSVTTTEVPEPIIIDDGGGEGGGGNQTTAGAELQKLPISQNDVVPPIASLDEAAPLSGAYGFTLPIASPPGINGFAPAVSLIYSSDGAEDGMAGAGFSLSVEDCIVRRGPAKTTERQGLTFPNGLPTYTDSDTFYMNGDRLVRCDDQAGGATASCPAGTYRKRVNDFVKITKVPASKKFVAYRRDGSVAEYAAAVRGMTLYHPQPDTFDSYVRFCVSRITKDGNAIDYTYQDNDDWGWVFAKDIQTIDYGGQSAATHRWRFKFNYENRPPEDRRIVYDSGGYVRRFRRLASIEVLRLPSLARVRKMALSYEVSADTRRSRLRQAQEFGTTDTYFMPPYVFSYPAAATGWSGPEWQTGANGMTSANVFTQFDINARYPGDDYHGAQWPIGTSIADLNGDGLPDLVRHDGQLQAKAYLNNPAAPGNWAEDPVWSSRFATIPVFFSGTIPANIDRGVRLADLNGDGFVDVVQAHHSAEAGVPTAFGVWIWDPGMNAGAGGFNSTLGSGFRQVMADNSITFSVQASWPSLSQAGVVQLNAGTVLSDVNGDGLPDIFMAREFTGFSSNPYWTSRHEVWLNTGTTFVRPPSGTFEVPFDYFEDGEICNIGKNSELQWPRDMGVRFGDFNGDGLQDIVQIHFDFNHQPPPIGPSRLVVRLWMNNGRGWEQNWLMEHSLRDEAARHDRFWLSHVERVSDPQPNYRTSNLGVEIVDINSDGIDDFVQRVCYDGAPPVVPATCELQWRSLVTEYTDDPVYHEVTLKWRLASEWLMPYYTIRFRSATGDENLVDLENGFRFIDFDRDGAIDLFANKVYNGVQSALLKPSRVRFDRDRITSVRNPYGGRVTIQYALSDGPGRGTALSSNPQIPMPKVVVGSLDYWNGRSGGDALGEVHRTRAFHYFGGRFDPIEREFAGFRAVTVAETLAGLTSYTTTWYGNRSTDRCHPRGEDTVVVSEQMCTPGTTNCFIGSTAQSFTPLLGQTAIQTNRILKVTQNTFPGCSSGNVLGPFFAPVSTAVKSEYDPAQPSVVLSSKQRYLYDAFGNRVNTLDYLRSTDALWFRAHWAYYFQPTSTTPWMPDRVCQQGLIVNTGTANRAQLGEYFYYDNNETSICQITTAGKPTKVERTSYDPATGMSDFTVLERFSYTTAGNVATHTDGRGKVWRTDWVSSLPEILPATTYDALNRPTYFTYDPYGNRLTALNLNGVRNEARYDGLHRRYESWDEVAGAGIVNRHLWSYYLTADPTDQRVSHQVDFDPGIYLSELDYLDGFGKPYLEVHYGTREYYLISNLFDGAGRQRIRTAAWLPYNGFVFDIDRPRTEHRYDILGREIETIVPGGYRRTRAFSVRQNEQGKFQRLETLTATGPGGFVRRKFVMEDSWDRLAAVAECSQGTCPAPNAGAPGVHITTYTYNGIDKLTDIVLSDGISRIKSFYNGFGWLTAVKDPDSSNCVDANVQDPSSGCPRRYTYDANGNVIMETDPKYAVNPNGGTAIGYFYDDVNRRTGKSVASGWESFVNYTFEYDQDRCATGGAFQGQLVEERFDGFFESSSRTYCYDRFGRIASTSTSFQAPGISTPAPQTVQYGYTLAGQIKRVTQPDGEVLTYGFEDFGRVKSLSSSVAGSIVPLMVYNLHGQPDLINYGNGYVADFAYRLGPYTVPAGDLRLDSIYLGFWSGGYLYGVNEIHYDYDPSGNVKMIYDYDFVPPDYQEYGYDQLDRLTSWFLDFEQKQTFTYDPLGNFTQRTELPAAPGYVSYGTAYGGVAGPHAMVCEGPNQASPCTSPSKTYTYDRNGNMTSYRDLSLPGPTSYAYDMENHLRAVVPHTGDSVSYFYGPDGESIADYDAGRGTIFINPMYELVNGVPARTYRIDGKIMARREGSDPTVFITTDHLGSVSLATDTNAQTIGQRNYEPFGATFLSDGTYETRLGFNGKRKDSQGVYDYGARSYNPEVARFLQPDTLIADIGDPQTINRYAYTLNNPLKYTDPTGKCSAPSGIEAGQVGICIGSFISTRWVGFLGLGDDREAVGDDPKATYRSQFQAIVDPSTGTLVSERTDAGTSAWLFPGIHREGSAESSVTDVHTDKDGNTTFTITHTSTNGFAGFPFAPKESIDFKITLMIDKNGKVTVVDGQRDGYPTLEIYQYDANGKVKEVLIVPERKLKDLEPPMEQPLPPQNDDDEEDDD